MGTKPLLQQKRYSVMGVLLPQLRPLVQNVLLQISPLVRMDFHRRVSLTLVNKMGAVYERPRVNVKVERGSTFNFMRDLPNIASILFARVKFTCVRMHNQLRDSDNPPLEGAPFGCTKFDVVRVEGVQQKRLLLWYLSLYIFPCLFSVRRTWSNSF